MPSLAGNKARVLLCVLTALLQGCVCVKKKRGGGGAFDLGLAVGANALAEGPPEPVQPLVQLSVGQILREHAIMERC
jgi:hypothetical protein